MQLEATSQPACQSIESRAFHQWNTEYCLMSIGLSELLPVTPTRTTGFSGRTAYRMYGFQSQRGAELCETMRHWYNLSDTLLRTGKQLRSGRFDSGEGLNITNAIRNHMNINS